MLALTAGAFLLVTWAATKGLFFFLQGTPIPGNPIGGETRHRLQRVS